MEVLLKRCNCEQCELAEQKLNELQKKYPFTLKIEKVLEKPDIKDLAGWSTPMVCVNGKETSHFTTNFKQWEKAIQDDSILFS